VIGNVFLKIKRAPWFEPADENALARYLIHHFSRNHDEAALEAMAEAFAREWFPLGRSRFDALSAQQVC
jgi:hypothetical protein